MSAHDNLQKFSDMLNRHPVPWHWRDRYDFREHLEHRDNIFEVDCDNRRDGRIELVDANGEVVLVEWADYAGDAGLTIDEDVAKFIVAAVNAYAQAYAGMPHD